MSAARRAVTLIELLVVVVILGLTMGVAVGVAGPMTGASSERSAIASLQATLERARATGMARGECALVNDPASGVAALRAPGTEGTEPQVTDALMAHNWAMAIYDSVDWIKPTEQLVFDHEGRCPDAFIELRGPREALVRFELLGAVGQLNRVEIGP